ncbi:MAG: pyridoxal phosphate-dependent aminotransferase, partial [Myxococcales bacterium]|nr:pyridoxal phosphate-dependent aminotransferase [Myxococcales bacterium]
DFETPAHVQDAARAALGKGSSHYTAVAGIPALRQAIVDDSKKRRGGQAHELDEVIVSVGAKHSLFNLALALLNPEDEVIIPAPYWVSYPEQVRLAGATPVIVSTSSKDRFRMSPLQLEAAVSEKTKALVLCTPSNPTGAAYTEAELRGLAEVIRKHNFWVIVDEIYAQLVYGGFQQKSLLEIAPDLRDRLLIVDGVSKTFAMTGWRIGWLLGPKEVVKACDKIQGQATTNPTAIAQHATIAALTGTQEPVEAMRRAFERRRTLLVEGLGKLPGFECAMPEGAFYAFPRIDALLGKKAGDRVLEDDVTFATWLLEEARCAVVPGTAFGAPGHLRISYATSEEQLEEGLRRMGQALAKLSD